MIDNYTGHFKEYTYKSYCDNDSKNNWHMSIFIWINNIISLMSLLLYFVNNNFINVILSKWLLENDDQNIRKRKKNYILFFILVFKVASLLVIIILLLFSFSIFYYFCTGLLSCRWSCVIFAALSQISVILFLIVIIFPLRSLELKM